MKIVQFFNFKIKKMAKEAKRLFIRSPLSKLEGLFFYVLFSIRRFSFYTPKKTILIYISSIDPPGMRLFQLFSHFIYCGYTCYFYISFPRYMELKRYGKKATLFKGVMPYVKNIKKYSIVASDNREYLAGKGNNSLKLFINFHILRDLNNISQNDIFYPLVHFFKYNYPSLEKDILSNALTSERKIGAFFAGNIKNDTYNADITGKLFNVNTRHEVFNYIIEKLPKDILYLPKDIDSFLKDIESGFLKSKIVLLDINNFEIPKKYYFKILLQANFFIHMCGVIYPYCHNQIESMMAGCIPVTQFADFFIPQFQNEKNALLFKALDDLLDILLKINSGSYFHIIEKMRQSIIDYYKNHYSFQSFSKKLSYIIDNNLNYTNYYITTGSNNIIRELVPKQNLLNTE